MAFHLHPIKSLLDHELAASSQLPQEVGPIFAGARLFALLNWATRAALNPTG